MVTSGGRVFFLRTDEIDWIEAAGNYVRLHLGGESHLSRETMNHMEARLDSRQFVRILRSRIVNTDRAQEPSFRRLPAWPGPPWLIPATRITRTGP